MTDGCVLLIFQVKEGQFIFAQGSDPYAGGVFHHVSDKRSRADSSLRCISSSRRCRWCMLWRTR